MEVDADIQRENGVTENASFNGLDETSEDVKMTADETSLRKSKVCTCIYIYGSACRRIFSYIEFFGSDLLTTILGKLNFKYQKFLLIILLHVLISFCMFYFVEVRKKEEEEIKEGKHMTFSFYY